MLTVQLHSGCSSIKSDDFDSRLTGLGVNEKKVREIIATRTIRNFETLEISNVMLKIFHMVIRTDPEWVKHAVAQELANTSTERYNLFPRIHSPMIGLEI